MATPTRGPIQLFHQPWRIAGFFAFQWAVENRIISSHALTIMYSERWLIAGSIDLVKGNPQERDLRMMKMAHMFCYSVRLRNGDSFVHECYKSRFIWQCAWVIFERNSVRISGRDISFLDREYILYIPSRIRSNILPGDENDDFYRNSFPFEVSASESEYLIITRTPSDTLHSSCYLLILTA
jgi:hypothetical protein